MQPRSLTCTVHSRVPTPMRISCHHWFDRRQCSGGNASNGEWLHRQMKLCSLVHWSLHAVSCTSPWYMGTPALWDSALPWSCYNKITALPWSCYNKMFIKWIKVKSLSRVRLSAAPWTLAYQAPPSMGFSRQEYWSGLPFPSPGNLPDSGIEPKSPALQADALPSRPPEKCLQFSNCITLLKVLCTFAILFLVGKLSTFLMRQV